MSCLVESNWKYDKKKKKKKTACSVKSSILKLILDMTQKNNVGKVVALSYILLKKMIYLEVL